MKTGDQMVLALPNPGDWVSIDGAAAIMHCDEATVRRMCIAKKLTPYWPEGHPRRWIGQAMLWRAEVVAMADARRRVKGCRRA